MRFCAPLLATAALLALGSSLPARADNWAADAARAARPHHVYLVGNLRITRPYLSDAGGAMAAFARIENTGTATDKLVGGSLDGGGALVPTAPDDDLKVPAGSALDLTPKGGHLVPAQPMSPVPEGTPVTGTLKFEKAGMVHLTFARTPADAQGEDQTAPASNDKPVDLAQ